jgi:hypothetical protein
VSDTPRTDALHYRTCAFGGGYRMAVLTDMCRELERELAAITAERDTYKKALHGISLGSQNSMTSKDDLGREARAAITQSKEMK